jgi:hypothetical protein
MLERVRHLQSSCKSLKRANISAYRFSSKQTYQMYYMDEKSNLSYCKVPKIGSSFMTDIFLVLDKDRERLTKYSNKSSESVHQILELDRESLHIVAKHKKNCKKIANY